MTARNSKTLVQYGGIYSSTRQAIKGPAVVEGRKLYIYPEQYEGEECHPLIFCTGPVPAQQVDSMIPWLMQKTGAKKIYCPSADYIWPHTMNRKLREVATANGGAIVGEEYLPLDHTDYGARRRFDKIMSTGAEVVFNTIVPPGLAPFVEQLHKSGFKKRGGHLVCTFLSRRTSWAFSRPNKWKVCPAPSTATRTSAIPSAGELLTQYKTSSIRAAPSSRLAVQLRACTARFEALGGCRQRGQLVEARRRHQSTGSRKDLAGAWRPS